MLCAVPITCRRVNSVLISWLIQLSSRSGVASAHAAITAAKSRSADTSKLSDSTVRSRRLDRWNRSSGSTPRISGSSQYKRLLPRASAIGNSPDR
jgi:hypothetical protein